MKFPKIWICCWLTAAVLSCYIRLYPLRAHMWDPTYDKASLMVVYKLKSSLLEQIHAQAPQMPRAVAENLASTKLNETLRKDAYKFHEAVDQVNQQLFKSSGNKPNTYLLESDPFYYYYLTENIVKTGRIADQIKGSKYLEPLMTAPTGFWQPTTYHPYVGFWVYRIAKIFNPDISLMAAVAYTPLILICLVLAAFFWLCYTLELSAGASFVSSLFFIMAPVILKRSSLGWYDTDPYNLLFPLLLLTILIKTITSDVSQKIWQYILLFALVICAFASIWQGWGFMLVISIGIVVASAAYDGLTQRSVQPLRRYAFFAISLIIATIAGISLLFGFTDFFSLLSEGLKELQKFTVKNMSLWPNLFMEVGELKKSSVQDILTDSGGLFFLSTSILSVLYALQLAFKRNSRPYTLKIIALGVFLLACIMLTIPAERFYIFALMGLALFLTIGLDAFLTKLASFKLPYLAPTIIVLLALFVFINAQKNIKISLTPIFNSAWEKSLVDIKNNTPEDSIVNCWWPPGHFIKAIAHRRVMFDGATLSESTTGYWMANILLSQDEEQAAGLLRMLNLSGNKGVDFLLSKGLKTSEAVALLATIAARPNTEAKAMIQAVLNSATDATNLLSIIRGGYPHSYVLLYNDLVEQNLGLSFMGKWNIKRIEQLNENPALLAAVPARNSPEYIDFLWNLAGGPTHYSPAMQLLGQNERTVSFTENLLIDKTSMQAVINSSTYGQGTLASVVYQEGNRIVERVNPNANLKYSVVLYIQDGQPMARLMDRNLANSMLIKLFFFNGAGMTHFKPLTSSSDTTGRTQIKVFEAVWK